MSRWTWSKLLLFEAVVCTVSLICSVAGAVAPILVLTVSANGLAISSKTVFLLASSLVPSLVLLIWLPESRSAVIRFSAGIKVYLLALGIGFLLPLASYIGARQAYPLWGSKTGIDWIRVFFINLLLSPLWEEIIWRGYFYPKASSMLKPPLAVVVAASGWALWHAGFIFFLYHSGISISILPIFIVQLFFVGMIQCSVFSLGDGSLAPCVLLHTAANASTTIYYGSYNRVADTGSYVAEMVAALLIATTLFRVTMKGIGGQRGHTPILS
jgi:membrane protease YdiL (CAAX protease family)